MIYLVKGNSELIRSAVLLRSDEITTLRQSPQGEPQRGRVRSSACLDTGQSERRNSIRKSEASCVGI